MQGTNQTSNLSSLTQASDKSELEKLYQLNKDQLTYFNETVSQLEELGHKLRNTNYPKDESGNKSPVPIKEDGFTQDTGIVRDFANLLLQFREVNERLYGVTQKLNYIV